MLAAELADRPVGGDQHEDGAALVEAAVAEHPAASRWLGVAGRAAEDRQVGKRAADEGGHRLLAPALALGEQEREAVAQGRPIPQAGVELAAQGRDRPFRGRDLDLVLLEQPAGDGLEVRSGQADGGHRALMVAARPDLAGPGAAHQRDPGEAAPEFLGEGRGRVLRRAEQQHQRVRAGERGVQLGRDRRRIRRGGNRLADPAGLRNRALRHGGRLRPILRPWRQAAHRPADRKPYQGRARTVATRPAPRPGLRRAAVRSSRRATAAGSPWGWCGRRRGTPRRSATASRSPRRRRCR